MFPLPLYEFIAASQPSIPTPITLLNTRNLPACGFIGNNDVYGIGIRIGIYTQILAVWFSNYFLISQAQVLRDSVSIFAVAILIVCILFASYPSDVYVVEAFIMLQILAWSCIMGVKAKSSYTKAIGIGGTMRRVLIQVVYLMNGCLHVWFWWTGMDKMQKTPCGTFLMMYVVKTSIFGWARKVMMAMSTFVSCVGTYFAIVDLSGLWAASRTRKTEAEFTKAVRTWADLQGTDRNEEYQGRTRDTEGVHKGKRNAEAKAPHENNLTAASTHDCCSQYSCSRCSPVEFEPTLNRETTLVHPKSTRASTENSRRLSYVSAWAPANDRLEDASRPMTPLSIQSLNQLSCPDFAILRQVYEGELYIQHCVAASPYQLNSNGGPLPFSTIIRAILQSAKYRSDGNSAKKPLPSWFRCYLHVWKCVITFRFTRQASIVYSHLRQSLLMDPLNGPIQTYAALMYTQNEKVDLPPWRFVSLSSKLLLTRPDRPKKVWLGWYYTILDLIIHVIVMLQLELTLRWNRVTGLNQLWTSLGQLVPFIIGLGGLLLVGARWAAERWKKRKLVGNDAVLGKRDDEGPEDEFLDFEPEVREGYSRWKEVYEASLKAKESAR